MRVRPREDDFSHFVARGFGGIRLSAAGNPLAAKVFIEMLASAVEGCELPERRAVLAREAKQLEEQAEVALAGPALDEIRETVHTFVALLPVPRHRENVRQGKGEAIRIELGGTPMTKKKEKDK